MQLQPNYKLPLELSKHRPFSPYILKCYSAQLVRQQFTQSLSVFTSACLSELYNRMDLKKGESITEAQQQLLQQKRLQLKSLQQKCDLQNKKIKLFRKENEEIKHALVRQAQADTSLLLNSKELSDNNAKLEAAIQDITKKLQIDLESVGDIQQVMGSKSVALVTIQHTTVTEETEEVDLPNQGVTDQDVIQLQTFKGLKSLMLGENKIGNAGVTAIVSNLPKVVKLQLNSNNFTADALAGITHLQNLKVLDIRNNNLGDGCLKYLSTLLGLQELSISKNAITDVGIREICVLVNLLYLDLTTNQVTDEGVRSLLDLKKLTHLYMMTNRLTEDSVYMVYGSLPTLQVLDVRFNINDQAKKEALRERKPEKLQLFC